MDLQECVSKTPRSPQIGTDHLQKRKNKNYQGKIVQHDAREQLYKTLYEDGDAEELSHEEVIKYIQRPQSRLHQQGSSETNMNTGQHNNREDSEAPELRN